MNNIPTMTKKNKLQDDEKYSESDSEPVSDSNSESGYSDTGSELESESESEFSSTSESDLDEKPNLEYHDLLKTLFPSKYTIHDLKENEDDDDDDSSYCEHTDDSSEKKCVHIKKPRRLSDPKKTEPKIVNIFFIG